MANQRICDKLERPLQDLRISIMDRCNFRCSYCMPAEVFGPDHAFMDESELLSVDEIVRTAEQFVQLGVKKIRITGGEPLLRKEVAHLIGRLHAIEGLEDLALTTNGVMLPKMAKALKAAGLQRVNISLDALSTETFQKMSGRKTKPQAVFNGIAAAKDAGLGVKINMVVKRGANEQEVIPLARYAKELGVTLRFIEFMDVGQTNGWDFSYVVSKKELYKLVSQIAPLEPVNQAYYGEVASRYRYSGTETEVGFISSVTETFCQSCTRARLSADGKIFTCLFSENGTDLRADLRKGLSDEALQRKIKQLWEARADRYSELRTEETAKTRKKIEMSYIGG
ncbi:MULTISPECIES: GTP 3',8-cyclase MoaA [Shouchella]|uniref:GTP 3',8-cyclase n=2 Tax=Shouchella TaxID=2893057 RepID=A0A268NY91_SHOCL|nr:GTP 3',8-cyclase MoaA [Shouchella clausii]MBX0320803.1 GTP 3',8-cyclase MoaA [Shouchella clausii]PAD14775.1 GTP 3',8-cyclase MoaA [Shouchella clausii]PAD46187.1 GTP 3',8-cyclase MoaA [Shouchella clausii]PAE79421.1 GTP 3',8-cyclase MoaA [Shouchella clausii]PAE87995.1 GTP 3',8-cyclase MoaA [Shouchella clausii]